MLTPADVLRLDVAAANARQQEIQANAAEQVSRSTLLVAIGRQADDPGVTFVEPPTPETAQTSEGDLAPLVAQAMGKRTEVQGADLSAEAARKSARSRTYELLPDVDLEAGYMHMTGQTFVKKDSAFIGLRAGWQIWDWGARWYQRRAARAQATAAGGSLPRDHRASGRGQRQHNRSARRSVGADPGSTQLRAGALRVRTRAHTLGTRAGRLTVRGHRNLFGWPGLASELQRSLPTDRQRLHHQVPERSHFLQ